MNVHIVSKDEHIPQIKRQNRVIKERAGVIVQTLPQKNCKEDEDSFNSVCSTLVE
jgi:hypothetical protein